MKNPAQKIENRFLLVIILLYIGLTLLFAFIGNQELKEATSGDIGHLYLLYALAGLPFLLLAIYVVKRECRKITSSLSTAMNFLDEIGFGNFDIDLNNGQHIETGHLLEAMQTTSNRLDHFVTPIEGDIQELVVSVKKIFEACTKYQKLIDTQLTINHALSDTIENVNHNFVGMKESSNSEKTNSLKQESLDVKKNIENISQSLQSKNVISNDVSQTVDLIAKLKSNSDAIATEINSIVQIASQTNMLALNAAIEAARAGEQGRGFAVVADEVRTLAQKTADVTTTVQQAVDNIQLDINEAINTIEKIKTDISDNSLASDSSLQELQTFFDSVEARESENGGDEKCLYDEFEKIDFNNEQLKTTTEEINILTQLILEQSTSMDETMERVTTRFSTFNPNAATK